MAKVFLSFPWFIHYYGNDTSDTKTFITTLHSFAFSIFSLVVDTYLHIKYPCSSYKVVYGCLHPNQTIVLLKEKVFYIFFKSSWTIPKPFDFSGRHSTSHSTYVATSTKSYGVDIDGLLPPNFFVDSENVSEKFLHRRSSVMILKKVVFFQKF